MLCSFGARSLREGIFVVGEVLDAITEAGNRAPVGALEPQLAVGSALDAEPALVQRAVMMRAEQRQILEARVTTLGPVLEMMRIEIALTLATWERAAAVT